MPQKDESNQVDEECGTGMPPPPKATPDQEANEKEVPVICDIDTEKELHVVLDIDTDGDQILPADDEKEVFKQKATSKSENSDGGGCSKYPGILAAGTFDTADTESSVDGSEASTDAGEISGPTTDEEADLHDVLRLADIADAVARQMEEARKKMYDMLNWCEIMVLHFNVWNTLMLRFYMYDRSRHMMYNCMQ